MNYAPLALFSLCLQQEKSGNAKQYANAKSNCFGSQLDVFFGPGHYHFYQKVAQNPAYKRGNDEKTEYKKTFFSLEQLVRQQKCFGKRNHIVSEIPHSRKKRAQMQKYGKPNKVAQTLGAHTFAIPTLPAKKTGFHQDDGGFRANRQPFGDSLNGSQDNSFDHSPIVPHPLVSGNFYVVHIGVFGGARHSSTKAQLKV